MKEQLIGWRNKILSTDEEQGGLRERIAALAPAILPKGVGAYSAAVLEYEMRGFERFTNRRQVGGMTGLCPGIHQSDGRGKEGSINRCGIGIVRWTLVEMGWRLMIWQPQYPPVRRLAGEPREWRKLHLLLDHDGYLPVFAHLSEGRVNEIIVAKNLDFSIWRLKPASDT
jgi:Transposase IS116/IS110/IS902 family